MRAVVAHARLIAEVDVAHPIVLDVHGRVMDGMHRVARALLDGHRHASPRSASRCSRHRTSSTAVRASSRTTSDGSEGARVSSSGTR